jgi:hypothetical protein
MGTEERLQNLCHQLDEVESQLAPLQAERERLRAELSVLVEAAGGKTSVDGFGRLEVSKASVHVSYDRKLLETVILKLIDLGQYHVADAIRSCKKESMRPAVLRIMRALGSPVDAAVE